MDNFRYDEVNDAYQHLHNTVVMTSLGIPFLIRCKDVTSWVWEVCAVGDFKENRELFDIRSLGITFAPISLGYSNTGDQCSYLVRRPVRMWKQGLSYDHLKAKTGYMEDDFLSSKSLLNSILGHYPSLSESYYRVSNNRGSSAFDRDFALSSKDYPTISLEYKGDIIGQVSNEGNFNINDKFFFVREQLEEVLRAQD